MVVAALLALAGVAEARAAWAEDMPEVSPPALVSRVEAAYPKDELEARREGRSEERRVGKEC